MKIKGFRDTIEWYNKNAKQYAQATSQTASIEQIDQFAKLLPKEAKVLDAGCGFGRDKETDRNPKGRLEVEWILALARKKLE